MKPIKSSPGRVLCWTHKYGTCMVFARTPAEDLEAYLMVFKAMDGQSYYWDVGEDDKALAWYLKAKEGDGTAAKCLLEVRSDDGYQYEGLTIEHIETVPTKQPELGGPDFIPDHTRRLVTKYAASPAHAQALLDHYLQGGTLTVTFHSKYTSVSADEPI